MEVAEDLGGELQVSQEDGVRDVLLQEQHPQPQEDLARCDVVVAAAQLRHLWERCVCVCVCVCVCLVFLSHM